ncbi:hypothetical protein EXIGLDRAFT_779110 [Exidia glandulosa HHB12029]|uniref:Uncharacterized protein n=1 Tax=Exidia glandulosa HHB12029 TaxID=1314781 RepID=A0A165C7K7_EXIGL|nr:hypothetical protein EXIGLDRAFT_779110 [Exidia glandulosa HHB12029]
MGIIEYPSAADVQHCPFGTIVLISVDPLASVATLRDERASEEAARIPRGKFLVMVSLVLDIDFSSVPEASPLKIEFFAVGRGLPDPPYACVALSADAIHPTGRPPIMPASPLPWPDCYIHTIKKSSAQITRIHLDSPSNTLVADADITRVTRAYRDDARALHAERAPANPVVDPGSPDEIDDELLAFEENLTYSYTSSLGRMVQAPNNHAAPNGDLADTASVGDEDADEGEDDSDGSSEDEPHMEIRAEMWLDVSVVDSPGDTQDLLDTIVQLTAIKKAWAQREVLKELADQPRTRKWVASVAGAGSATQLPAHHDAQNGIAAGDNLVSPNDALDYRAEHGDPSDTEGHPSEAGLDSLADDPLARQQKRFKLSKSPRVVVERAKGTLIAVARTVAGWKRKALRK